MKKMFPMKKKTKIILPKYDILLYPQVYASKNEMLADIKAIKNNILDYPASMSIKEIANASISGYAMSYSYGEPNTANKRKGYSKTNWVSQQILALDFDNNKAEKDANLTKESAYYLTYDKALKICIKHKILPAFIYLTQNSTKEHQRFRIVFSLDEKITNLKEYRELIDKLCSLFTVDNVPLVDLSSTDSIRIYASGRKLVYENYNAITSKSRIKKIRTNEEVTSTIDTDSTDFSILKYDANNKSAVTSAISRRIEDFKKEIEIICKLDACTIRTLKARYNKGLQNNNNSTNANIYIIYNILNLDLIYNKKTRDICVGTVNFELSNPIFDKGLSSAWLQASRFPLHLFFNMPFLKNVCCLLPKHKDHNPSARFERDDRGCYFYHCYACNKKYNIFELLGKITGANIYQVYKYVKFKLDLQDNEWIQNKKDELRHCFDYLHYNLKDTYPLLFKTCQRKNILGVYSLMLDLACHYIPDIDITQMNKVIFYRTLPQIAQALKDHGYQSFDIKNLYKKLLYLERLGLIECLQEKDLPVIYAKRLEKIRLNSEQKYLYRINCYSVPVLTDAILEKAEQQILQDKKDNVRFKYFCREAALRVDKKTADLSYAQDANNDTAYSKESELFYERYKKSAQRLLDKQGWTTEKQICAYIRGKFSNTQKERRSQICLPQLLNELKLKKVGFSKSLEEKYGIINNKRKGYRLYYGVSKILIPIK